MFIYRRAGLMAGTTYKVGTVTVTNAGSNDYTGTPSVVFTGGGGTGAAATANMSSFAVAGSVTSVTVSIIQGYYTMTSGLPTIFFTGGGGSGAAANFTGWTSGQLAQCTGLIEVSAKPATFSVSGGGGSGATIATQTLNDTFMHRRGRFTNIFVNTGGSGYSTPPTVVFTLKSGYTEVVKPTAVAGQTGGVVDNITLTNPGEWIRSNGSFGGQGYDVTLVGGSGSGATLNAFQPFEALSWYAGPDANNFDNGSGFVISNPGSGYTSAPTITPANLVSGTVTAQIGRRPADIPNPPVTTGGSYTSAPGVAITGGDSVSGSPVTWNTSASGTWGTRYRVNTVTVTNQGSGYRSAPVVSFSGGGEIVPATAVANLIPG